MTDQPIDSADEAITAAGVGAVIPTALLVALLGRQTALPSDPVTVDARSLQITVPTKAFTELLRTLYPDRTVHISFAMDSLTIAVAGMPAVRIDIPPDGMRLHVDEQGFRLGGR